MTAAFLLDDSEDIEAAIRGEGDEVPDGLDRDSVYLAGREAHGCENDGLDPG